MKFLPLITTLALAAQAWGADAQLLGLLAPESKMIAGMDVQQTKASPFGQFLLSQLGATAQLEKFRSATGFDPLTDFTPIANIGANGFVIAVNPTVPVKDLKEFTDYVKARPAKLNYGSGGAGSTNHLAATLFRSMTGLDFVIMPFRTPGDLVTAAIRNDVDAIIQSYGALKSAVEEKQLRALAGTTAKRTPYAPNVPTVDELGVKGFEVVTWNGFFAPARTPPEVVDLLNREIAAVLADADLKKRFLDLGLEPLPEKPVELGNRVKTEIAKWAKVIADAKIEKQ